MRNWLIRSVFMSTVALVMVQGIVSSDGKSGKTGAPGENNCTQCHAGVINSNGGSVSISGVAAYQPGQTYDLSVTVSDLSSSLFGFSIVALKSDNTNAGTFTAGVDNHLETLVISGAQRSYLTHNYNSGATPDAHTFNFTWTAPSSEVGQITFYATANAANGNGGTSGDHIYSTTLTVSSQLSGCTNSQACNYNPAANQDNGSCILPGSACNDNNPLTANDVITDNCVCAGTIIDLNGNNEISYQGLFYQAVARNMDGSVMSNQSVNVRFSLRSASPNGVIQYQEVQNVNTNEFGLMTTYFGTGVPSVGDFNTIPWGTDAKYLQVELDVNGWQVIGTQQLAAVPFALRAKQVDPNGYQLKSPNGNCYILQIADDGTITPVPVNCNP